MHILVTGGSGLIGSAFINRYSEKHQFTVLSRNPERAALSLPSTTNYLRNIDELENLDDFDAVLNLAGEPIVDKRWSSEQKQRICQSRWQITEKLVNLIQRSECKPSVFISGSAIGIYGEQGHKVIDEQENHLHHDFAHQICQSWEEIAQQASRHCRTVLLRTGIVLGKHGGALEKMRLPFLCGLGGRLGDGNQVMSWIHIKDMVEAIQFLLEKNLLAGPFNLTSPSPVNNAEFTRCLAATLKRPAFMHVPAFALRLLMGERAELMLTSQHVIPYNLLQAGFEFQFPDLRASLEDILLH